MNQNFEAIVNFIIELEKLKSVYRKTKVLGTERQENSAEHSWQVALLALSLSEYAEQKGANIDSVVKMLLLHDAVEIDVGDVIVYDQKARDAVAEKEQVAAKRIFALLPASLGDEFLALWLEYEQKQTAEAKFAYALDRFMPMLLNIKNNGQSWVENGIRKEQVLAHTVAMKDVSEDMYQWTVERVEQTFAAL